MASHTVTARNDAATSENRIHDDLVARRYGFRGGLVPGVTVYAYATRAIVDELGPDWLSGGTVEFRLPGPLYESERAMAVATRGPDGGAQVELTGPEGRQCLTATAAVAVSDPLDVASGGDLPTTRPPASESSLAPGTVLAPVRKTFDTAAQREYLDFLDDDLPVYRSEGIAHPGWLSRYCNRVLAANVLLDPWIHVGTAIAHHGLLSDGEELEVRGAVVDNWERKGHRFVDLDVAMSGDGRPVASARHTAIWRVRPVEG